jgi:hypothetical protein
LIVWTLDNDEVGDGALCDAVVNGDDAQDDNNIQIISVPKAHRNMHVKNTDTFEFSSMKNFK